MSIPIGCMKRVAASAAVAIVVLSREEFREISLYTREAPSNKERGRLKGAYSPIKGRATCISRVGSEGASEEGRSLS
jgi:hypothetical protein